MALLQKGIFQTAQFRYELIINEPFMAIITLRCLETVFRMNFRLEGYCVIAPRQYLGKRFHPFSEFHAFMFLVNDKQRAGLVQSDEKTAGC